MTLTDAVTASFYAWETRGRGWMLADYPVSLEPPFRPFFVLPELAVDCFVRNDDGKRPTVASLLVDSAMRLFSGMGTRAPKIPPPPPYIEQAPFVAFDRGRHAALRILVPPDFTARADVMVQLLSALSTTLHPIAFELIGTEGRVGIQLVCGAHDAAHVAAHIEGFMPDVAVIEDADRLAASWDTAQVQRVVDFGLAHEFFLPLAGDDDFRIDPYVALIPALAEARAGEFVMLSVLAERVRNPWTDAITEALDDGDGGCLIADAPWFLTAAKEKLRTPAYAVVLRVSAQARTEDRAWELIQRTYAFIVQYTQPGGNALAPLTNEGYGDQAHALTLLLRESFRTGMLLSAEELASLLHLPDQSVRHPALLRAHLRTKELPDVARGHDLILGTHRHRGVTSTATLDHESRFAHTWVVGGSGTGKSTLLANLILQDIAAGHGIAVLDPHGDLIDDIVARIPEERCDDVILFDPADAEFPIGFNILDAHTDIERNLLASDLVAIFRRFTTSWGDTMSTVLGEAVLAVLSHPAGGTLIDLRRFLIDASFRKAYLARVSDPEVQRFWEEEYALIGAKSTGPLLSRLDAFLRPRIVRHIVGQPKAKLDLGEVMGSGKVFLAKLSKGLIGEENAALLGSLLVAKFNQLALARQGMPKSARRPFLCYADEFQHFVTPSMESLATEGRKYRFGLTLAHQTLAQLADLPKIESALLGNCHTRIVFRVGEGDARKLADGFSFFEASDLSQQARGEAVVRIGGAGSDFNLKTTPLAPVDADDAAVMQQLVIDHTRSCYAMPVAGLLAELAIARAKSDVPPDAPTPDPPAVVTDTVDVMPAVAPAPKRKVPAMAPDVLKAILTPPPTMGRGGEVHKYLQHLIKRLAEERGFRAAIEGAAGGGKADVVLTKEQTVVGCEISITTNAAHELENLRKCIGAGFTRILFVSPEKKQRDKVAALIRTELAGAPIDVIGPEDIVTALDALNTAPTTSESVVRGYKVKVTRQNLSPEEDLARRKAVAGVIARGVRR